MLAGLRFGPHDMQAALAALRWSRHANIVKSVGNPAAIIASPDHAIKLWRWPFSPVEQDRMLAAKDVGQFAERLVGPLNGYHHRNLYLEGPNEIAGDRSAELCTFLAMLKDVLARRGYALTGPCWATGDYGADDVERLRRVGLALWTMHGYMTYPLGPTEWNAYRMRQFWRPGDPPVVYGEAGFDRCRDGDATVNDGYLPLGDGPYGWFHQFAGVPDPEEQAATMLEQYAAGLTRPWEWGGVLYTTSPGPGDEWTQKGFNADQFCDRFAALYAPWSPPDPAPTPTTQPTPPKEPSVSDWCPFAIRQPIAVNYSPGRNGQRIRLIVDHVADGLGNPWGWFNTTRVDADGTDRGSSALMWASRAGELRQYRPITDTCWANGPKCQPDVTNPIIAALVKAGLVGMNSATAAIEHEGFPGQPLTAAQIAVSRRAHEWIAQHPLSDIPTLDRTHVVGHYQVDRCTRANCPGPTHPWAAITTPAVAPTHWPNGRVIAPSAEYDRLVWGPAKGAINALLGGGDGDLGDDAAAHAIAAIVAENEARHGITR